jgi:hypothetical protein
VLMCFLVEVMSQIIPTFTTLLAILIRCHAHNYLLLLLLTTTLLTCLRNCVLVYIILTC